MKILTAAEMQACDRATREQLGIPSLDLMRSAARAVATFALDQFKPRRVLVLCGRGNNGGDGMMAARLLIQSGCEVTVLLLGDPQGLKGDAAVAWQELKAVAEGSMYSVSEPAAFSEHAQALANADLVLDAVVGTGFSPPLRDLPLAALDWLKGSQCRAPILAVDLPSGWDANSTAVTAEGPFYPAEAVVTFTAPKPAHVFGQLTRDLFQPIVVASIGSPPEAVISEQNLHWSGSAKAIADQDRPADSNKGMYGHVLVIGGSHGKSGAPAMSSLAALRSGAGLVTAAVTPAVLPLVAAIAPELMTQALAVTPEGEISAENLALESRKSLLNRITVLAIGPGLGSSPEASDFALGLLSRTRIPAVIDADALNALAEHQGLLPKLSADRFLVLTPHPGEMSRLTGKSVVEIQSNRLQIAREFATRNQVTLVLKGWRTLIAHADGSVAVNTTGNPGMAKGGSGDLLTGIVAGMLAQFPDDPKRAVEAAVYLHGLAADIAVQQPGIGGDQHTLLATDSLGFLHRAFRFHPVRFQLQPKSEFVWVQGLPEDVLSAGLFRGAS